MNETCMEMKRETGMRKWVSLKERKNRKKRKERENKIRKERESEPV